MQVSPEKADTPTWWKRNKKFVITGVTTFALTVGITCAIILPLLLPAAPTSPVIPLTPGWQEWSTWSECSLTCGQGSRTRSRTCRVEQCGSESLHCDGYPNGQIESARCIHEDCATGMSLVYAITKQLRQKGVEDFLFLNRYAAAVTDFGNVINANGSDTVGYGLWRLTETNLGSLLVYRTTQLEDNINTLCENQNSSDISLQSLIGLVNDDPCASAVSLVTLLEVQASYPPPLSMLEQEALLSSLTDQVVVRWDDVLSNELFQIQNECLQSEIDFEFVIDSSGSVGPDYWNLTMDLIGNNYIKDAILPIGSPQCGNHVAGRWFSSNTERFYDFEPPNRDLFNDTTYPNYVGEIFINYPYYKGGTNTGGALQAVRLEDVPMTRNESVYILVFTDGQSNEGPSVAQEAPLLHNEVDRVYAIGIDATNGINSSELGLIASHPAYSMTIPGFELLKEYARILVVEQDACYVKQRRPSRAVRFDENSSLFGMSYLTAQSLWSNSACHKESNCPANENKRTADCLECSQQIAYETSAAVSTLSNYLDEVGYQLCFPIPLIYALVSRLSVMNGELITLKSGGWTECKQRRFRKEACYGIMQIPQQLNPETKYGPKSIQHISQAVDIILELIALVTNALPDLDAEQATRRGIAAYDTGIQGVLDRDFIDQNTTNMDFSADVFARAQWFDEHF